jgi:hypothetical protein
MKVPRPANMGHSSCRIFALLGAGLRPHLRSLHAWRPRIGDRTAALSDCICGDDCRRFCLLSRLLSGLMRLALLRVDLRLGLFGARASSSANEAFRAVWGARLRAAVERPPLRRKVALAPGSEVSTTRPGADVRTRALGGRGRARSCAALNCSAFVATAHSEHETRLRLEHWNFGRAPTAAAPRLAVRLRRAAQVGRRRCRDEARA